MFGAGRHKLPADRVGDTVALFSKKTKARKLNHISELQELTETGKPVLLDFYQAGCAPCQVMDGIMNELAREYGESAHIVKVDIHRVPGAIETFGIRATPTIVLLSNSQRKLSKKKRQRNGGEPPRKRVTQRFRTSGLVKKDQLQRSLESNGAVPVA